MAQDSINLSDAPDSLSYQPTPSLSPAIGRVAPSRSASGFGRFVLRLGIILGVLFLLGLAGIVTLSLTSEQGDQASTDQISPVEIPLGDLPSASGDLDLGARSLSVNGPLKVNDTLVLAPQSQPTDPVTGQLYYDQTTNVLGYYNGGEFVNLGGEVNTIQGGAGITVADDGEGNIVLSSTALGGVQSVQGQTGDVTLIAGNGIAISGTAISNTGVLSLASGSPSLTVVGDGSGNLTITSSGGGTGSVTSSGGTAGRIAKFTGAQNIEDSLMSESGSVVTVNGDLAVAGSSITNTGALSIGVTGQALTLQGSAATVLTATDAGNTNTLGFITPSGGNKTINVPNEAGTLCVQASANCGFALATTAFVQGGNSFGAPAILGTNDNFSLNFETNNLTRVTIEDGGQVGIATAAPDEALTVNGNLNIRDADVATKQVRLRTSGGTLDLESAGTQFYVSSWQNADFSGTQFVKLVFENSTNITQAVQQWQWRTTANGTTRHIIDGSTGTSVIFNDNAEATNFTIEGDTDANAFFLQGSTDRVGIGTNTPGAKLHVSSAAASPLFTVTDATVTAADVMTIADEGAATFQNRTNSATAFRVMNATAVPQFVIDTTNSRAYVGNPTGDSTGALIVLDTKNTAGDPTGVNGAMYYNSSTGRFRCFENSAWINCVGDAGELKMFAGSTAPTGWLLCDGSAVSRTTFAGLFAVVGTTYGAGDGSTTFNLPDFRGRVAVGRDAGQTEFDVLGESGGAKTHTLTTGQLPSHDHTFSGTTNTTGAHTHGLGRDQDGASGSVEWVSHSTGITGAEQTYTNAMTTEGNHSHTISGTSGTTGSGQAHNILQPYMTINYIIKT